MPWYKRTQWQPPTRVRRPPRVRKRHACSSEIPNFRPWHSFGLRDCGHDHGRGCVRVRGLGEHPRRTLACPRHRRRRLTQLSDYGYHDAPVFYCRHHVNAREHVLRAREINRDPGGWLEGRALLQWGCYEDREYLQARRIVWSSRYW